jgi:hypothetical protein
VVQPLLKKTNLDSAILSNSSLPIQSP